MSMQIRPQDLPELRAELAQQMRETNTAQRIFPAGANPSETEVEETGEEFSAWMRQADMFHVSEDMGALAAEAAKTLERFPLQREDVPTETGLIVFDGSAPYEAVHACACTTELRGLFWRATQGLVLVIPATMAKGHHHEGSVTTMDPAMSFRADFGDSVEELFATTDGPAFDVFGLILTTWLLMGQQLAATGQVEPDRAARKRLQRLGAKPGPVRVITLRRPKSNSEPSESGREYHHRWITRGHWRQHWYPKRQVHRPVWIAPHIKGPEGAPLIGGEKVYALKR